MNIPYAIALALSGFMSAVVTVISWRRRSINGAVSLAVAMAGLTLWAVTYSIRWLVSSTTHQLFWLDATYIGVCTAPTAYFVFSMQIANQIKKITRRQVLLLSIEPILTLLILWTDQYHGLFYAGKQTTGAILTGGVWFWINAVYSYLLLFIAAFLLFKCVFQPSHIYHYQAVTILIGLLLPWVGTTIGILGISPFPDLDITPFTFLFTGIILAQALFRRRLLDIGTIARNTLVENMIDGTIVIDKNNRLVDINSAARSIFNFSNSSIGKPIEQAFSDYPNLVQLILSGKDDLAEVELGFKKNIFYEIRISSLYDHKKNFIGKLFLLRDISDKKIAEHKILESESKYRTLFENSLEMILVIQKGEIKFCNRRTSEITGYPIDELMTKPVHHFIYPDDFQRVEEAFHKRIEGISDTQNHEFRIVRKDGALRWVIMNNLSLDWDGLPSTLNFLSDISEQKQTELELLFQNTHDYLTGLFNRQYFQTELERLAKSRKYPISLIMVDMDGLKQVNDTLGHNAGDDVLQHAANILKDSFRPEDMISRLGGDEFVVVLPETDETTTQSIVDRLKNNIRAHNQTCLSYQTVRLSIGAATGTVVDDFNSLLSRADKNMYEDKAKNKAQIRF